MLKWGCEMEAIVSAIYEKTKCVFETEKLKF